ncbi:MAG: hypothetical protein ACUVXG_05465 [Anaerolineae bacterium]
MTALIVGALVLMNLTCVVASNVSFKFSALSPAWQGFLRWQVVGNLTGFLGVLSLTGMLRYMPLHVGYGISAGLSFVLVELMGSRWLLHEEITWLQWIGVSLAAVGVSLIALGKR